MNAPNPYMLPTIDFVGGSSQELVFHTYFRNIKNPFDLSQYSANFSVINYVNKNGTPVISKSMRITDGERDPDGNLVPNILRVTLVPGDTVNLTGKFIYQISVKGAGGMVEVPSQGIIYITNNINKKYISG